MTFFSERPSPLPAQCDFAPLFSLSRTPPPPFAQVFSPRSRSFYCSWPLTRKKRESGVVSRGGGGKECREGRGEVAEARILVLFLFIRATFVVRSSVVYCHCMYVQYSTATARQKQSFPLFLLALKVTCLSPSFRGLLSRLFLSLFLPFSTLLHTH